jgi:hypothetical protein
LLPAAGWPAGRAIRAGPVALARLEVRGVEALKGRIFRIALMLATFAALVAVVAADTKWK